MPRGTAKTELFAQWGQGTLVVADQGKSTGNRFWVGSGVSAASDSAGYGKSPEAPFATLDYAIGQCTASQGDIIYVMENHAESLASAGAVTVDVVGVNIIGLGSGESRPTFTFATAAAASVVVSADDCYMSNLVFICNIDNQNHMIDLSGDHFTIEDCEFLEGSGTGLAFITADTADGDSDYCTIRRCLFYAPSAGNYDAAIQIGKDHTNWLIEDCDIYGDFDEAGIDVPAGGNASALLRIYNNRITQLQADDHAIQINGTAVTGWAVGNKLQTNAVATAFDTAALSCHDNTWCDTDGNNDEEGIPTNTVIAGGNDVAVNYNLDHLGSAACADTSDPVDMTAEVVDNSILANILDDGGDTSAYDRRYYSLLAIGDYLRATSGAYIPGYGFQVTKNCDLSGANDDLFTVTGKVMVTLITGQVEGGALSGAEAFQLRVKTTNEPLCAATTIDTDADGTMYIITGDVGVAMNGGDAPTTNITNSSGVPLVPFIVGQASGSLTIESNTTGNGGTIAFTLYYYPLEASASVAAAA